MSAASAAALALVIPLLGAVLIVVCRARPNLRETVTLVTAGGLFAVVASMASEVLAGARPEIVLLPLLPAVPLKLTVEPLGMLFALVASGLWFVTSVYSIGYMRAGNEPRQTRFYACFALALASAMGVAFAGNMLTLFIFYEALTLSTYPLVIHRQDPEAVRGGRTYLGILLSTSIGLQLVAIIWTWQIAGTLDFTVGGILAGKADGVSVPILLGLYMFGIGKAALMPFHRWLPAAMVAPAPVSALLHAVAVVKAGVFTVMKVVVYIFGIDFLADTGASEWLVWVAAGTVLVASLVAMTKDNLKARLAYSTVSQLAYVVLGAAVATSLGVIGGTLQIVMHAFGKITLFFCAGAIYRASQATEIKQMSGLGRAMPFTFGAFFIAALSIIGLPPLGGLWSKWYLVLGALEADRIALVAVLMISSMLNVAYLLAVPLKGFFGKPGNPGNGGGIKEAPLPCLMAIGFTTLGCVVLFFFPEPAYDLASALVGQ